MKRQRFAGILILLAGVVMVAFSIVMPQIAWAAPKVASSDASGWEKKWNDVLEAGKKEGLVVIYGLWRPSVRDALTKAFYDKYGIKVQFVPFGRAAQLQAKVETEKQAGMYAVDVFGAGNPALIAIMKPKNLLGSLKPLLILPEVLDPQAWRAGRVPLTDEEGSALSMIGTVIRSVVVNTNLVNEKEITTYRDLLKPQYKGKITMDDASVTGPGNAILAHLSHSLWGEKETVDFLRKLIRDQGAVIQRDNRIHIESVAKGKYAIAFAPLPDLAAQFMSVGAPVKFAIVKEDNRVTAAAGALGVPTKMAHPNAATVFINWLLTKEGQTIFAHNFGNPSTRADVSSGKFNPLIVPVPGEKYFSELDSLLGARKKWLQIAKEVIAEAGR